MDDACERGVTIVVASRLQHIGALFGDGMGLFPVLVDRELGVAVYVEIRENSIDYDVNRSSSPLRGDAR